MSKIKLYFLSVAWKLLCRIFPHEQMPGGLDAVAAAAHALHEEQIMNNMT